MGLVGDMCSTEKRLLCANKPVLIGLKVVSALLSDKQLVSQ